MAGSAQGGATMRQCGDVALRLYRNVATRHCVDTATWRRGTAAIRRYADTPIRRQARRRRGDAATQQPAERP